MILIFCIFHYLNSFRVVKEFLTTFHVCFYEARQMHLSISLISSTDFARREKNELKRKRNITHLKRRHLFGKHSYTHK